MKLWQQTAFATFRTTFLDRESKPARQGWPFRAQAFAFILTVACVTIFPDIARAAWPERSVKLIVTFPPGSANDAAARIFADGLSKKWGKPVVVEDKPGAEGTIGVGAFVAAQDDHTLLYTVAGSVSVAPLLIDGLTYNVDRDLVPIAATTAIVLTLAISNDLAVKTITGLIDVLRSNPGKYAWTSGPSLPRYVFASFLKRNGLLMNFVSYRDASQPQADLGEGRIQVLVTSMTASASPVQTGKARFLAVISPARAAALPELKICMPSSPAIQLLDLIQSHRVTTTPVEFRY